MEAQKIYQDIAKRCGGDIYIGVVGPVRTGKSTFIKRFMDTLVIPGIFHSSSASAFSSGSLFPFITMQAMSWPLAKPFLISTWRISRFPEVSS